MRVGKRPGGRIDQAGNGRRRTGTIGGSIVRWRLGPTGRWIRVVVFQIDRPNRIIFSTAGTSGDILIVGDGERGDTGELKRVRIADLGFGIISDQRVNVRC